MTFTATGSLIQAAGTSVTSFTVAPSHVGDLIVVEVFCDTSGTEYATALTSTNVQWTPVTHYLGTANAFTATLFLGKVISTASATVTITWSGATPGYAVVDGQEFTSTAGAWAVDKTGHIDTTGSNSTWASLTPAGPGELYFGWSYNRTTAVAGSTPGYTYTVDSDTNGVAWCTSTTSGAQAPVWSDTSEAFGIMVLIQETSAPASLPPLIPPAPFSPMSFQRRTVPSGAPLEAATADTATGTEATSLAATVPGPDTAAGTEGAFASPGAADADPGLGSESQTVTATLPGADTGAGTEGQALTASLAATDTGAGSDAATASLGAGGDESGTATDTGQLSVVAADTGTGTDLGGGEGVLNFRGTPPFTVPQDVWAGTVTLNGITPVAVVTSGVDAMSVILLTVQPTQAPVGMPYVVSVNPANGFKVASSSSSDVGVTLAWWMIEAA